MEYCIIGVLLMITVCSGQTTPLGTTPAPVAPMDDNFIVFLDSRADTLYQMDTNDPSRYRNVTKTGPNPVAIAYDPNGKRIYFADVRENTIKSVNVDGTDLKIVKKLLPDSDPEGLAIDPDNELLYYADNGRNIISVMKLNGSFEKTVVSGNITHPRAIQLDPVNKKIYWSDWGLGQIDVSNMDGTERSQIAINNTEWPNGLAIDIKNQLIYFCDARTNNIEEIDLKNNNARRVVLEVPESRYEGIRTHFFGITLDDTYLYLSDWEKRQLHRITRVNASMYHDGYGAKKFRRINGLTIYNATLRVKADSVCQTDNGGCSHLCIPVPTGRTCMCPNGYKKLNDTTCSDGVQLHAPGTVWIEQDKDGSGIIRMIHGYPKDYLGNSTLVVWQVPRDNWHWRAMGSDFNNKAVIMADQADKMIMSVKLNGLGSTIIYEGTSSEVQGIAVDWLHGNIYWTDSTYNKIMIAKNEENTTNSRAIVETGLEKPRGIVVHPVLGYLFWAEQGKKDQIERSNLDGTARQVFVAELYRPNDVAIDSGRLYWVDKYKIESMLFDKSDRKVHYKGTQSIFNFVSLTVYKDTIFACDGYVPDYYPTLWFMNTTSDTRHKLTLRNEPFAISMYQNETLTTTETNVCASKGCDHLCTRTTDRQAQCLCRDGYNLNSDKRTCTKSPDYDKTGAYIYSLGNRICRIPISIAAQKTGPSKPDDYCFLQRKPENKMEYRWIDTDFYSERIFVSEQREFDAKISTFQVYDTDPSLNYRTILNYRGLISGIYVDYISNNLYWTDGLRNQLLVSRTDGSYPYILQSNTKNPSAITVDHIPRTVYWCSGNAIYASDTDGKSVARKVVRDISSPTGLVIDYVERRLYWSDNIWMMVGALDLDTEEYWHQHDSTQIEDGLNDITLFQDFIVFTDYSKANKKAGIQIVNKETYKTEKLILHDNTERAYGIVTMDKSRHHMTRSLCDDNNGGCNELCLGNRRGRSCQCTDGHKLVSEVKCMPNTAYFQNDGFLLIADRGKHLVYSLSNTDPASFYRVLSAAKTPNGMDVSDVLWDSLGKRLYRLEGNSIKSSLWNGSLPKLIGQGDNITEMALDNRARLLYYSYFDATTQLTNIKVYNLQSTHKKDIVKNATNARGLEIDFAGGYLYFATLGSGNSIIERVKLDGTDRMTVQAGNINYITDLSIDYNSDPKLLYWADSQAVEINRMNLDDLTQKRVTVWSNSASSYTLDKIAVNGSIIYFNNKKKNQINKLDNREFGTGASVVGKDFFFGIADMEYVVRYRTNDKHPCVNDNGGCSEFCFRQGVNGEGTCGCRDGDKLKADKKTCDSSGLCTQFIKNGDFDTSCSFKPTTWCAFMCNPGYKAVADRPSIRCDTTATWMFDTDYLCTSNTCGVLAIPENSMSRNCTSGILIPGVTCGFHCKTKYEQTGGDKERTCRPNLGWSGSPLVCTAIDYCKSNPCKNNGVCRPTDDVKLIKCYCRPHFTGPYCESSIPWTTSSKATTPSTTTTTTTVAKPTKPTVTKQNNVEPGASTAPTKPTGTSASTNNTGRTQPLKNKGSEGGASVGGVVGGVIAACIIVAIAAIVGFFMWRRHQVNKQTAHRQFENPVDTMPDGAPISPISDKDPIAKYDASMDSGAVSIAFDNPGYNSLRGNKNNNFGKNGNANTEPLGNTAVTNPTYGISPTDKIDIVEKPPLNDSDFINAELQPVEANGGPQAKIPAGDYVDPDSVKFDFQNDVLKGEASSV